MNKVFLFVAVCVCCVGFIYGEVSVELAEDQQIALLISTTEHALQGLKEVQVNLQAFRAQESRCIEAPDDAESLYRLSELAYALLSSIRNSHTSPYFRPAFLDELERISKVAQNP